MTAGSPRLAAIGCYTADTGGRGNGISLVRLVPSEGIFQPAGTVVVDSPSYLAWDAVGRTLFAVHENSVGWVSAYRFTAGGLAQLSTVPSEGASPCHLAVHPSGEFMVVSNYLGGTFSTLPIADDGAVGPATGVVVHHGRGLRPARQEQPHPHSATFTPDGRFVVLVDLGIDRLALHAVDIDRRSIDLEPEQVVLLPPGTGPRHSCWLADGRLVVVGELDATLAVFAYDRGLRELTTGVSLRPSGSQDDKPSEIIAVDDRRVMVGNRRYGLLSEHEMRNGRLGLVRELPLPAPDVRHFAVAGGYAFAALQDGNLVVQLDLESGEVTARLDTGSPTYIALRPSV